VTYHCPHCKKAIVFSPASFYERKYAVHIGCALAASYSETLALMQRLRKPT
jgi:hypothetical protein